MTPYFEGVVETLVILSKKNGKSTLIAALVIFHILTTPDAECIVVAVSREQAEIILKQAAGFIRRNPGLRKRLKVLRREILSLDDVGRARVIAADEATGEGVIPTLAIVDELHGAASADMYDSLRLGLDGRQGQMVTITIAGATMTSPLGKKRDMAYAMPGFVRDRELRRSYVRSEDGEFAFLEWCLNPDDDPNDLDIVKLVNPAPWKTKERLAKQQKAVTPWTWLRKACGVWTEGEEPGIDPPTWDALAVPGLELKENVETYCALHFGRRGESAAIALAQLDGDEVSVKVAIESTPSFAFVEERVRQFAKDFQLESVIFDRRQFARSAEILESEGFNVLEHPQSHERMVLISATVHKLIEEGKLHHDGDKALRAQVLACRVKETERDWKYVSSTSPIDGLLALATAAHIALEMGPRDYVM